MIASRDIEILKEAGIDSPDLVVSAAAAFYALTRLMWLALLKMRCPKKKKRY